MKHNFLIFKNCKYENTANKKLGYSMGAIYSSNLFKFWGYIFFTKIANINFFYGQKLLHFSHKCFEQD